MPSLFLYCFLCLTEGLHGKSIQEVFQKMTDNHFKNVFIISLFAKSVVIVALSLYQKHTYTKLIKIPSEVHAARLPFFRRDSKILTQFGHILKKQN